MKNFFLFLAAVAFIVLGSCSSRKFHTTRIQSMDFSKFKTYGWLPPVDSLSKDFYNNDIARDNILSTANKTLEQHGLTYSKDNPDILFRYIALVNNKSKLIYSSPYYGGFGWGGPWGWYSPWSFYGGFYGGSYPVAKERVRYGHLILEAIDRSTNTVIWQARGFSEVSVPEKAINDLPKMVTGVLKEYPFPTQKR
ncbi:DUF4136 domain-containing protein [Sphingobacterium sp. Mn56C]|uniref:DUF4136 domain-containing protein n=1 Tax=Sphingobacterium sp. Mn56C TaxID=3395261 RepID=UPI003BC2BAF9